MREGEKTSQKGGESARRIVHVARGAAFIYARRKIKKREGRNKDIPPRIRSEKGRKVNKATSWTFRIMSKLQMKGHKASRGVKLEIRQTVY